MSRRVKLLGVSFIMIRRNFAYTINRLIILFFLLSTGFPIAFQSAFAMLTLATVHFLPESPRWLYAVGRHGEGDDVLARLKDKPIDDPALQSERAEIFGAIELEKSTPKLSITSIFWDKSELKVMRRIVTGFTCQWWQQFAGIG
jgi:hypothetical protein